jgi:translation elongation factor EF-Tu-like GTPase
MEPALDILVNETYPIAGRATVVSGTIRSGVLRVGDMVQVVRPTERASGPR